MVYASATQSRKAPFFNRDQDRNLNNNNFSSDTLGYINKYANLTDEISKVRQDLQEATQPVGKDNGPDDNASQEEKNLTSQYNAANGANSFYDAIRAGNASNVLEGFLGALKKQLDYYADKLGINPNSSPPSATQAEGQGLARDNSVGEVQEPDNSETNQQPAVPNQSNGNAGENNRPADSNQSTVGVDGDGVNRQDPNKPNCGPNAIANALGTNDVNGIDRSLNRDGNPYTTMGELKNFLGRDPQSGGSPGIINELQKGKNVVVPVDSQLLSGTNKGSGHLVAITGYTSETNTLTVEDPLKGKYQTTPEQLEKAMQGPSLRPQDQGKFFSVTPGEYKGPAESNGASTRDQGGNVDQGGNSGLPAESKPESRSATPGVITAEELNPEEKEGTYNGSPNSGPNFNNREILKKQIERENNRPLSPAEIQ